MSTTALTQRLDAPPSEVYRALTEPASVARWMFPDGMSIEIHDFDARVGGRFRISLTYEDASGTGKSSAHTDTYHGRFLDLVPGERVVQALEFETADPAMQGEMTITFRLSRSGTGTRLEARHDGVPSGIAPADNETGWRMSLGRLKALLDGTGT